MKKIKMTTALKAFLVKENVLDDFKEEVSIQDIKWVGDGEWFDIISSIAFSATKKGFNFWMALSDKFEDEQDEC